MHLRHSIYELLDREDFNPNVPLVAVISALGCLPFLVYGHHVATGYAEFSPGGFFASGYGLITEFYLGALVTIEVTLVELGLDNPRPTPSNQRMAKRVILGHFLFAFLIGVIAVFF